MEKTAYKFRLYPDREQDLLFRKTFGCCRFLYNRMLEDRIKQFRETGKIGHPTPAKYKAEYPWLKEVDSLALANVQLHLESAYRKYFRFHTGHPRFKSRKSCRKSYTTNMVNGNIRLKDGLLRLPKAGYVKIRCHRSVPDEYTLKSVTISLEETGKYYASLLYEYPSCRTQSCRMDIEEPKTLQIRFSADGRLIFSDGSQLEYPMYCRNSEERLEKQLKSLSRCREGSRNYAKQLDTLIRCREKVKNQKTDYLHKLSREIADCYDRVVSEAPARSGSYPDPKTGNHFSEDYNLSFLEMLRYKLIDQGKEFFIAK